MPYLKALNDEIVGYIRNNPEEVKTKQSLISPTTSYDDLRTLRRVFGVLSPSDEREISEAFAAKIRDMAEHNFLAYLHFIQRFDVIRELFSKDERIALQVRALEAMEREEKQAEDTKRLWMEHDANALKNNQILLDKLAQSQRINGANVVLNIEAYLHQVQLIQKIHDDFHIKQITIMDSAYTGRVTRMKRAIEDPGIDSKDKLALIQLKTEYEREYQHMKAMPTRYANGSINSAALKSQSEEALRIDSKYQQLFARILDKYPEGSELGRIFQEEQDAVRKYQNNLQSNRQECQEHLNESLSDLAQSADTIKANIDQVMTDSIKSLKEVDMIYLSAEQHNIIKESRLKLAEYQAALNQTNDPATIKELSKRFAEEMGHLKAIVKPPVLGEGLFKNFESNARLLYQLHHQLTILPEELLVPPPPSPPYNVALANDVLLPYEQSTARFRDQIQVARAEHKALQNQIFEQNSLNGEHDETETTEVDEETKSSCDDNCKTLKKCLDKIFRKPDASPEEQQIIVKLKQRCDELISAEHDQYPISKMMSLMEQVEELKGSHEELNEVAESMNELKKSLGSSPRLGR